MHNQSLFSLGYKGQFSIKIFQICQPRLKNLILAQLVLFFSPQQIRISFVGASPGTLIQYSIHTHLYQAKHSRQRAQISRTNNLLAFIIFFRMMSEFGSFEESEYSRFQPNYFNQIQHQVEKLSDNLGPTCEVDEVYAGLSYIPQPKLTDDYLDKEVLQQPDPKLIIPSRQRGQKNIIQVGQKFRNKYLLAKKGTNEQTNDLSINVCTLIKTFCEDYETFECMEEGDIQLIKKFQKGKSNLEALRKLMRSDKNQQNQVHVYYQDNEPIANKMRTHFSKLLQQPQTVMKILCSKKMKFTNKITFIKYLENIRKRTEQPENLKGWKNNIK